LYQKQVAPAMTSKEANHVKTFSSSTREVLKRLGLADDFELVDNVRTSVTTSADVKEICPDPAASLRKQATNESGDKKSDKSGSGGERMLIRSLPSVQSMKSKSGSRESLPPPIDLTANVRRWQAYYTTASNALTSISALDVLGACGGICTVANSTVVPWASSVKIHSFMVWNPGSTSAATDAEAYWSTSASPFAKDSDVMRAVPQGITATGALVFVPPPKVLASDWMTSSVGTFVNFSCGAGSIIKIDVSYTLTNAIIPSSNTVATGTVGTAYYLALDGPATNRYIPVNLSTTH